MLHPEPHAAEQGRRDNLARPTDLVLIGHVGFATDRTTHGTVTSIGGSGFAAAFAAAALLDGVGLAAQVGKDFDLATLWPLAINMEGVVVLSGVSARFFIDHSYDGSLSFRSELGVAADPSFDLFPESYFRARYIHLGTAPPQQQLAWLKFLRGKGCRSQVSVDMFEPFVAAEPGACRNICDSVDLIFLNETEYRGLYDERPHPSASMILKRGPAGVEFLRYDTRHRIPASPANEVDPIGAGEILAGAFLALRARGLAENQALIYAVAAASRSVTEFGVAGKDVTRELQRVRDELESEHNR
jgi:sugar/nucleoside kinase (ribokinase family)